MGREEVLLEDCPERVLAIELPGCRRFSGVDEDDNEEGVLWTPCDLGSTPKELTAATLVEGVDTSDTNRVSNILCRGVRSGSNVPPDPPEVK